MKRYCKSLLSVFLSGIIALSVFVPAIAADAKEIFDDQTITLVPDGEVSETGYLSEKWINETDEEVVIPDGEASKKPVPNNGAIIPSEYSSVDYGYVSRIKDQEGTNSCWAFSAVAAAESSLLRQGLITSSDNTSDLSEAHLVWFTHKSLTPDVEDPTFGDGTNEGAPYTKGGYWLRSTYSLARGSGFTLEKDYPFYANNTTMMGNYDESARYESKVTLDEAYLIPNQETDTIKKAIMDNGSITVAACIVMSYFNKGADGYAYYQNTAVGTNHQMVIVGWDDNFSVDNFKSDCKPAKPGAWLIKNSYGTDFCDNGYFWISYEEPSLEQFVVEKVSLKNENESIYQYDGYGYRSARGVSASTDGINFFPIYTANQANVFTASANEMLSAVSFYTIQDNVTYTIEIYNNVNPSSSDPTSGGTKVSTVTSGVASYKGYHKVPLDKKVSVSEGEKFAVVVTFSISGGDLPVYIPVEGKSGESDGVYVRFSASESGQSYFRFGSGEWEEASGNEKFNNICVKAFSVPDNSLEIRTAEEFNAFAKMVADGTSFEGKNINLMNDIDFEGGNIIPVGTEKRPFCGNFFGNGFVLRNGVIDSDSDMVGVFSAISEDASIRKLGVENVSVTGVYGVGALCGLNEGTLLHCYSTGSVSGEDSVGGLVGVNCGTINYAYSICDVTGDYYAGSFVGEDDGGTYNMCVVSRASTLQSAGNGDIGARALKAESFSNGQAAFYLDEGKLSSLGIWTKRDGVTTFIRSDDEVIYQVELYSPSNYSSVYVYVSSAVELEEAAKAAKPGYYAEIYLDTRLTIPFTGEISSNIMLYASWKEIVQEHICADELEFVEAQPSDCYNDGIMAHYKCSCGKLYSDENAETEIESAVVKSAGHDYSDFITEKEADCENDGLKVKTCRNCGDRIEESITATGHSYNDVVTSPSCTEKGYTTYTCSLCDDSYIADYIDSTGHSYGEWDETDATCTENGLKTKTCSSCGDVISEIISATGHSYGDFVTETAPGCETVGLRVKTCSTCGDRIEETISARGHSYGDFVTETAPGCETEGLRVKTCSGCGDRIEEIISATGHSYGDFVTETAPGCETEGLSVKTCSGCGDRIEETISATGHSYGDFVTETAPGCETEGLRVKTCSGCGDRIEETMSATGHKYGGWIVTKDGDCENEGVKERTCSGCGDVEKDVVPAEGHSYNEIITEPTETEQGYTTFTCSVCGDSYISDYIDPITNVNFSGTVTSFRSETDEIKVELIRRGEETVSYSVSVTGNNADFTFENILSGAYTIRISKNNHATREEAIIIGKDSLQSEFKIHLKGDINGDGKVNSMDVARINAHAKGVSILEGYLFSCADINGDKKANSIDVARANAHAKNVSMLWK